VRNEDRFDITLALLELVFVRFSTALYPQAFMPAAIALLTPFSPVTMTSDAVRALLSHATVEFINILGLVAFVITFFALSAAAYLRRIEGGYAE
jgi:hypothetical protein